MCGTHNDINDDINDDMNTKVANSKNKGKEGKKLGRAKLNTEGQATRVQLSSNHRNCQAAALILEDARFSNKIRWQVYESCGCRVYVGVDADNKLVASFSCKKRYCRACLLYHMRKLKMRYAPAIDGIYLQHLKDKKHTPNFWMVTLTQPTCTYDELPARLVETQASWRHGYKAGKKIKLTYLNGFRVLEISIVEKKNLGRKPVDHTDYMYHVHQHLIIQRRANARFVLARWLDLHPNASRAAQNITQYYGKIDKNGKYHTGCSELIKYLSKTIDGKDGITSNPYMKAYMWMFDCLKGKRTLFAFGKVRKADDDEMEDWKKSLEDEDMALLDDKTDEEKQKIREDKKFTGKLFKWTKPKRKYMDRQDNTIPLTDAQDFDENNVDHLDPRILHAAKAVGQKKREEEEEVIERRGKELETAKLSKRIETRSYMQCDAHQ